MNATPSWPDVDALALQGVGVLAYLTAELDALEAPMQAIPQWKPGRALLAEAAWGRRKLDELSAAWGRKLVVALVGPSGAGKSTLLNALAGRELSPTGLTRPTTRQVVLYARALADVEALRQHCGSDAVRVETDYQTPLLDYLILVDAPDTNTLPENQRLLARVLERADLLLAIFPAQNPKLWDNLAFLKPYVQQFPAEAVIPILNQVDRIPRQELEEAVLPDFSEALQREWGLVPAKVYLVSAQASLPGSRFAADEAPLHTVNETDTLRALLLTALNQAGQVTDRRLARAEHLVQVLRQHIAQALEEVAPARAQAEEALRHLSDLAQQTLRDHLLAAAPGRGAEAQNALYGLLARRWWGPVGWLVAVWAFLVRGVAFFSRLARRTEPSLAPEDSLAEGAGPSDVPAWSAALMQLYAAHWPPTADLLVAAGFDTSVREASVWQNWATARAEALRRRWIQAHAERQARLGQVLASWPVQFLFNLPTLAMVGWVGVQTVGGFLEQRYLPIDYFRHAAIACLVVWLLSFVGLQIVISLALRASPGRSMARALSDPALGIGAPLQASLEALHALQSACAPDNAR